MQATWKPHTEHGRLTTRSDLPESVFAFPKQRKEPLTTRTMFEMPWPGSIKSRMSPTRTEILPSRT